VNGEKKLKENKNYRGLGKLKIIRKKIKGSLDGGGGDGYFIFFSFLIRNRKKYNF
jgi:hypothetical protein